MSQHEPEGGVLSRWSRRKLEAKKQAVKQQPLEQQSPIENLDLNSTELESPPAVSVETETSPASSQLEQLEQPALTDDDMPAIESLDANSDFSVFMSSKVSDKLRNLALKKMFHAPAFNIRDGLDEYDDDYTSFEKLGDIVTCDMKHQIEMKEKKKREAEEAQALIDEQAEQVEISEDENPIEVDAEANRQPADEPEDGVDQRASEGEGFQTIELTNTKQAVKDE